MKKKIAGMVILLTGLTFSSNAQSKPRNSYGYVVVTYACESTGKNIAVFSQVFGACYQETNHSSVARDQRYAFDQVARAACGGEVSSSSQRTSYPYTGPNAEGSADGGRTRDVRDSITYGYTVESVFLEPGTPRSAATDSIVGAARGPNYFQFAKNRTNGGHCCYFRFVELSSANRN